MKTLKNTVEALVLLGRQPLLLMYTIAFSAGLHAAPRDSKFMRVFHQLCYYGREADISVT